MIRLWTSLIFCLSIAVYVDGHGFRVGRATFFHGIHHGSCGYGHLNYHRGTGWNVAAVSDQHYEYVGSCGKCYEVRCRPSSFKDRYGNVLDRTNACYDPNRSIIVSIVDTCPCYYPGNHYSNSRWCCGDMDHLDLSSFAYYQLADHRWGVIGIEYRPVHCPNGGAEGHYPQNLYGAPNQRIVAFSGHKGRK